jgi:hypothetical protein
VRSHPAPTTRPSHSTTWLDRRASSTMVSKDRITSGLPLFETATLGQFVMTVPFPLRFPLAFDGRLPEPDEEGGEFLN